MRAFAPLIALLAVLACGGDDDGSTGPAQIPDVTGSFVGRLEMVATEGGVTITLECSARLDIGSQTNNMWTGVVHFTQSNDLCTAGETDAVSGTIDASRRVTMTLDDSDLSNGCTTFSGSQVFEGSLSGNTLSVATSVTCDGVQMNVEWSGTRS